MSIELVQFLREQLDEDERIAQAAGGTWWAPPDLVGEVHDSGGVNIEAKLRSFATHIAEHDPARVLRGIEVKRAILALHTQTIRGGCQVCDVPGGRRLRQDACTTVRFLAIEYADRPGYREEWRP